MQNRRSRLEIYHDILSAISIDSQNNEKISLTRIQFKSNLSFDKLKHFLSDMVEKKLLFNSDSLQITDLGNKFFDDYSEIRNMIHNMCNDLFKED